MIGESLGTPRESAGFRGCQRASPLIQRLRLERDALFARRLALRVLLYPVLPLLAGGAILAAEFDARDLGVADPALFRSGRGEVLDKGVRKGRAGLAVEDVGL